MEWNLKREVWVPALVLSSTPLTASSTMHAGDHYQPVCLIHKYTNTNNQKLCDTNTDANTNTDTNTAWSRTLYSNNTNYQKLPDLSLELRSQVAIRKGEEISTRCVRPKFCTSSVTRHITSCQVTNQKIARLSGSNFNPSTNPRYVSSTVGNFRRRRDIAKYWFFKWALQWLDRIKST